jgi:hypothetical protein
LGNALGKDAHHENTIATDVHPWSQVNSLISDEKFPWPPLSNTMAPGDPIGGAAMPWKLPPDYVGLGRLTYQYSVSGYLGITSSSYDGSALISGWTAACQTDYGSQAAVCNTKQIFESHGLANITPPNDGMWVTPFVVGGSGSSYVEYGGAGFQSRKAFCFNNSSGYQGAMIRYDFQVLNAACNLELPIACCR